MTTRTDITFTSADTRCAAWLYLPDTALAAPVIVMAHGLGSVRTMRLDAYAERFTHAGYACLVFDYRHFGASDGTPRQLLDIAKQLDDWKAAIAYARASDAVDGTRIVVWGTSFSGGHALAAAAADGRVSAVISQCPFTSGLSSSLAIAPWTSVRLTALALADRTRGLVGASPLLVPTAGKAGTVALMSSDDSMPGYLQLLPDGDTGGFENHVAARIALDIIRYYPGRRAAKIQCPILFAVCDADAIAPAGPTLRYARKAPKREIKLYPGGHFDIYVGEPFERVVADQIDFLQRNVPSTVMAVEVSVGQNS
jgi:pimeloyl-ACP methyl ester carboxylesterase